MTRAPSPLARPVLLVVLLALPAFTPPAGAQEGVSLGDVPALARGRAERQRPALEQKLAPHWGNLGRDPVEHQQIVDRTIQEVVALGDSIVPLLLEKLAPARGTPADRDLARNCAVILSRLDPANFTEALIDIATGPNYTAQGHAIGLLGMTGSKQAGEVLTRLLQTGGLHRGRRRALIRALTGLEYSPAAPSIAALLPCDNSDDHNVVVDYLMAVPAPVTIPYVLAALDKLRQPKHIMDCVRILRKAAVGDPKVAVALLPLLRGERLDQMQVAEVCKTLGTVAPRQHAPTITAMRRLLDDGRTGDLELEAAIALGRLGDKIGPQRLLRTLKAKVRGRNKREYLHHNQLGDFYLAFGDYSLAVRSYENAIRHTNSPSYRTRLHIKIARAEARRERWARVRKALRESNANYQQLLKHGRDHPELQEAYEHELVRKFLESLKPKGDAKGNGDGRNKSRYDRWRRRG